MATGTTLQLGNYPKALKLMLVLQSKISPCASIPREAEVRDSFFFPTVVSCLATLPARYSCWEKNCRAGVSVSVTTRKKKGFCSAYLEAADIIYLCLLNTVEFQIMEGFLF